ncbi:MAG: hypothetical protein P1U32_08520 [Legionellaceae bacterium]|nr:hypothetical protein [Legionellaceae bacterium]
MDSRGKPVASEADEVSAALLFELFNTVQAQHRPNIVACIDKFELGSTGKIKWQLHQEHAAQVFATPEENSQLYYDSRNIESAAP